MKTTDLEVIRVETALSQFPMHRLTKVGTVEIAVRDQSDAGDLLRWKVSHNSEYGQPGPLAYKLDTVVINRRIEAVGRPAPKLIRLGSLSDITRELGMADSGKNIALVKRALYQNAFAAITAKIRYRATDKTTRSLEFGTTRYAVVLTGETLPDGRRADAVYVILHDPYREILDTALTRPLDYDYLRALPPAPQRLYELLSYPMYAALKNGKPRAKLAYSEFCRYAPLTRYFDREKARVQMAKINALHRKAGYIAGVELEATTDREGRPDWMMIYTPGPKAKAEYQTFTQKGGRPPALEIEPKPEPEPGPEPTGLVRELIDRGVTPAQAIELVREHPEDRIRKQIGHLDGRRRKVKDPGAWLVSAIRQDFAVKAEPKARVEPKTVPAVARPDRERTRKAAQEFWSLPVDERARIDAAAVAAADPAARAAYEAEADPTIRRMMMVPIRDAYLAKVTAVG